MITKKGFAVLSMLSLAAVLGIAFFTQSQKTPVRVYHHDFGRMMPTDIAKHVFVVENASKHDWVVKRVTASCSCTVARTPGVIQRGKKAEVEIQMDLQSASETVTQTVYIEIEGDKPLVLTVEGKVIRPCPGMIDFGQIVRGRIAEETFLFRSTSGNPLLLASIVPSADFIDVQESEVQGSKDKRLVRVSINPKTYGKIEEKITIQSNDASAEYREVKLVGYVEQPVECENFNGNFGVIDAAIPHEREVTFRSAYGEKISIVSVEASPSETFSAMATDSKGKNSGTVIVRVAKGNAEEVVKGRLLLNVLVDDRPYTREIDLYAMRIHMSHGTGGTGK